MRKKVVLILVGLIVSGWWLLSRHHSANPQGEAILVEVAKVQLSNIDRETQVVGSLVAAKSVQIVPEIAGQVSKILFQDGAFVKQGTPLIQLDDAIYKAKLASAEADLALSQTTFKRMSLLAKQGIISRQDAEKAAANLKEKKAAADESQVIFSKMLLVAPFDGVLGKSQISPGKYVSVGEQIVSLTDVSHLHAEYSIAEKFVSSVKLNQIVKITSSAQSEKEFSGKVTYIAPVINTQDRTISLYAEVPNESGDLKAGLFVNVKHNLGTQSNALVVPETSLVSTIDGSEVFKVVNNKAVAVPVKVGQHIKNFVEIVEGLTKDDVVVIAGQQKIRDGASVRVKQAGLPRPATSAGLAMTGGLPRLQRA